MIEKKIKTYSEHRGERKSHTIGYIATFFFFYIISNKKTSWHIIQERERVRASDWLLLLTLCNSLGTDYSVCSFVRQCNIKRTKGLLHSYLIYRLSYCSYMIITKGKESSSIHISIYLCMCIRPDHFNRLNR